MTGFCDFPGDKKQLPVFCSRPHFLTHSHLQYCIPLHHHHHHLTLISCGGALRSTTPSFAMAFRQTLSRNAPKHYSSHGTVLDRFLISHSPSPSSSTSSSSAATASSSQTASLFEPTKYAKTGCWIPPKYSLRRQAKLVKEAVLTGQLSSLPDGPKTARIQQRLHRLAKSHAFEKQASQYQYIPRSLTPSATSVRPTALDQRVVKPTQRISEEEKQAAINAARLQVKDVGPYAGRARIFKGSKVDKDKLRRQTDVEEKLKSMKDSVKDWENGQKEAKIKLKPGLPF